MFQFGVGGMYGRPNGGNLGSPSGPQIFGTIQDVNVEFTQKLVPLMGQLKGPDDVAPSDMKITGKAAFGRIEVEIYNSLMFGNTISTGIKRLTPYPGEAHTIGSGTPTVATLTAVAVDAFLAVYAYASFTGTPAPSVGDTVVVTGFVTSGNNVTGVIVDATGGSSGSFALAVTTQANETHAGTGTIAHSSAVTATNAATYINDLGVKFAATGQQLQQVPSGPLQGQYSVVESGMGKGVYTFNNADAGSAVQLYYVYNDTSDGETMLVTNELQGYGPTFELYLDMPYKGTNAMHLFTCRASKMSAPLKRDNYLISDFEFESFPNAAGQWFEWFQATPGN